MKVKVPFVTMQTTLITGGAIVIISCFFMWQINSTSPTKGKPMALTARTILITGASRGLGLEYVKQLVKLPSPPEVLIAACRDPTKATDLQNIAKGYPSVKIIKLDVASDSEIESAFKEAKSILGDKGLNLLINNAAIYEQSDDGILSQVTRERMQRHFDINVSGPLVITQKFLPLLQQAAKEGHDSTLSFSRAGVVMMTSYMGSQSITYGDGAGVAYHYKCSKSAVNMAAVMLSRELKDSGIFVAALHPGWVRTDMGSQYAMLSPEESIGGCIKAIGEAGEDKNGKLMTYEGNVLDY